MNRLSKASVRRSQNNEEKKANKVQAELGSGHEQKPAFETVQYSAHTLPGRSQDRMRYSPHLDSNGRAVTPSDDSTLKRRSSLRRSFRKLSSSSSPNVSVASRLAIEVVPGSFHKVAGISADGDSHGLDTVDGASSARAVIRTVEIKLGADRSARGFDVEQRYRPNSGLSYVIARVRGESVVATQRLLRNGDEVIAVNGLPLDTIRSVKDVELLLRATENLRLRVRCVCDGDDARYTPRRSLTPVDPTPKPTSPSRSRPLPFQSSDKATNLPPAQVERGADDNWEQKRSTCSSNGDVIAESGIERSHVVSNGAESGGANGSAAPPDDDLSPERPPPPADHLLAGVQQPVSVRVRPAPPERKSSRSLKRRESLKSARKLLGKADGQPAAATVMLEMANVFVDDKEKMEPDQRRQLLAECLAEEFDLPFLVEQISALNFDD